MRGKEKGSSGAFSGRGNPAGTGRRLTKQLPLKIGVSILGLALGGLIAFSGVSAASVFLNADFEAGSTSGWSKSGGSWSVVTDGSKVYNQTNHSTTGYSYYKSSWGDYWIQARVKAVSFNGGNRNLGILARFQSSNNFYALTLTNANKIELCKKVNGNTTILASQSFTVQTGIWYTLKLSVAGNQLVASINGKALLNATDSAFTAGKAGVTSAYSSAVFDDVVVEESNPTPPSTPTKSIKATPTPSAVNQRTWAVQFADSILKRYPDINGLTGKGWEYSNGIVLYGIEKVYEKTHDPRYLTYIRKFVDAYIKADGSGASTTNLDHIQPGMLLLFLYRETGLNKYKLAADKLRASFNTRSRNAEGGFWHKTTYPNEMWVDGIYMGGPFLMKYGSMFNDLKSCANEASFQTLLLAKHAQDAKGLLRHGWDCDRNAKWANTSTGLSPEVWSRGMGWYAMALVDMLAYLPQDHPDYQNMVTTLKKVLTGLKNTQDPATGLWFQVVDKGSKGDNWVETSGSGMIVYAIKVAVDRGYVDNSYLEVARKGWDGMKRNITLDAAKLPVINSAVEAMGVQNSYTDYVKKNRLSNSPHGYCSILLAASQMDGY